MGRLRRTLQNPLFYLLLVWALRLDAGGIRAELDPQSGDVGDHFRLTVVVEGSLDDDFEVPDIPGVEIRQSGRSSNMSWINGKVSRETVYSFTLEATQKGSFTIPVFVAKIEGQEARSQPIAFVVGAPGSGKAKSQTQAGASASPGSQASEEEAPSGNDAGQPVFIQRRLSSETPYVGEPVIATIKIFHRVQIANAEDASKNPPEVRSLDLDQTQERERVGDHVYEVINLKRVLIPLHGGAITLTPFRLRAGVVMRSQRRRNSEDFFFDFFGGSGEVVPRTFSSNDSVLNVRGIPTVGRPDNYQGLVGVFTLESNLSTRDLKVGETATLTITVAGQGILDGLNGINLDLGAHVKIYPDKPQAVEKADAQFGVLSKKVFKLALVPATPGPQNLGNFVLPVFNPRTQQFDRLTADLGTITVAASDEKRVVLTPDGNQSSAQAHVQTLGKDLIDLHRSRDVASRPLTIHDVTILLLLVLMPSLLWLLVLVLRKFTVGLNRDNAARRASRALREYRKQRKSLPPATTNSGDISANVTGHYRAYCNYLGHKFDVRGLALTSKEIEDRLARIGLDADMRSEAHRISTVVDGLTYHGVPLQPEQAQQLSASIDRIVDEVEKRC